jgi:hypothetical protein
LVAVLPSIAPSSLGSEGTLPEARSY